MTHILYQTFMSLFASFCFAVLFRVRGRNLICASGAGGICWLIYSLARCMLSNEIAAYFLAAVATTIYCEFFARLLRTPAIVYLAVGIIPLVPGGGIYRTMLLCIRGTPDEALAACINAIGIAGALATGIVIVSSVVRLIFYHQKIKMPRYFSIRLSGK